MYFILPNEDGINTGKVTYVRKMVNKFEIHVKSRKKLIISQTNIHV